MQKQRVSEICFEVLSTRSTWSTRNADTFEHNLNDYLFLRQFPDIIWARISAFFGEAKKCRLRGPNYIGETDAGNMSFYS